MAPRARARGQHIVGTRWVNCDKGDAEHPEIKCRLVAQEVKTYQSDEFFSATPMTEALKMFITLAAEDKRKQVTVVDISRAYFNAKIMRKVVVELPPEVGFGKEFVGELDQLMYGTRGAAQGLELTYSKALVEGMGFRTGVAHPCIFRHPKRKMSLTVHGDDFFA